ncbi:hypothetical protein AGMMS4952_04870 [Spirochaetia bacterium]|nr:hypothetical protein AGMMS4952_04870 [Spirochaetia bacterium]
MTNKSSLKFLVGAALAAAVLCAACNGFSPAGEAGAEYDEQGRRLYTLAVKTNEGSGSRAINTAIAKNNVDFYEVVFGTPAGSPTEFYTAKATGDQPLKIKIPEGTYDIVLLAGSKLPGNEGILLAFNNTLSKVIGAAEISSGITIAIAALNVNATDLELNDGTSPIIATSSAALGLDYFKIDGTGTYSGEFDTGIIPEIVELPSNPPTIVSFPATELIKYEEVSGLADVTTNTPVYTAGTGTLTFNFVVPPSPASGVAKLAIDIPVKAFAVTGAGTVTWHIKNGVNNYALETGTGSTKSSGGSILLAVRQSLDTLTITPGP